MSKELRGIIDIICDRNVKAVSFDLFDILLQRPALEPSDIFYLVGRQCNIKGFGQRRTAAEKRARVFKDYYQVDVTLDEIYESYQFMFKTTESETERI
jgi:predicted HAD superfamily hydrolase